MKYFLLILLVILLQSCYNRPRTNKKWAINNIHPGIVINDQGGNYSLDVLDSGNIYHGIIDEDLWMEIINGDTIVNFK